MKIARTICVGMVAACLMGGVRTNTGADGAGLRDHVEEWPSLTFVVRAVKVGDGPHRCRQTP